MRSSYKTEATTKAARTDGKKLNRLGDSNIYYKLHDNRHGMGYIYMVNKERDREANITLDMVKSRNIVVGRPYSSLKPEVGLAPGEDKAVTYEARDIPYSVQLQLMVSTKRVNP